MAKGYAANATAAERDLRLAIQHLTSASASKTLHLRDQNLGWAIDMAEGAIRSLRKAHQFHTNLG